MNGGTRLSSRTLAIGIGVLVLVGVGAGVGGYELGLRAPRTSPLNSTIVASTSPTPPQAPTPSLATPRVVTVPSPRSNPSWVYDRAAARFVLYGGNTTTGAYNEFPQPLGDTWLWDGRAWTQVASVGPSPRFGAQAVYDEAHKVVMLHGGAMVTGLDADTWTWDGTRWLQMGPSQSPAASEGDRMAFDRAHGIAVLVTAGMTSGAPPVQTWRWDGSNWNQVATTALPSTAQGSPPSPFGSLAYDPGRRTVVFFRYSFNGQPETWTFDGSTWTQMSTTSGSTSQGGVMAEDEATSNVVLFGENGDTWTWDGSKWSPANPVHSPGQRQGMAMAYDPNQRAVLLFGGATGKAADLKQHNDIWKWDGADWTLVSGG